MKRTRAFVAFAVALGFALSAWADPQTSNSPTTFQFEKTAAERPSVSAEDARASFLKAVAARQADVRGIVESIRAKSPGMSSAEYTNLVQSLLGAKPGALNAAASAKSYRDAMATVRSTTKALGTSGVTEFVFYPVTPCRLLDSRASGIRLSPFTPYYVDMDGGNAGNASGCTYAGLASQTGGIAVNTLNNNAIAFILTVTQPVSAGFIQARPYNFTGTITSNVNFAANEDHAGFAIVQDNNLTGIEMELFTNTFTHAIIDVLGFFAPPRPTPLECTVVSGTSTVPAGGFFGTVSGTPPPVLSGLCPAGYTYTSGGGNFFGPTGGFVWWKIGPQVVTPPGTGTATQTECRGYNGDTTTAATVTCYANCCRQPGIN